VGALTLGGRYEGALPSRTRFPPAVSAFLICGFAAIVLACAGLAFTQFQSVSNKLIWGVVAYCLLGSLVNFITPSKRERALWFPVVAVMLVCSLVVALR
jgi:FtsH-binding integral membrane protein